MIDIKELMNESKVFLCPNCDGLGYYFCDFHSGGKFYNTGVKHKCGLCYGKRVVKIKIVPIEDKDE